MGVANHFIFVYQKSTIIQVITNNLAPNSVYTPQELYSATIYAIIVVFIILGMIVGAILGLIFGTLYDWFPVKRSPMKGLVFGFLIWLILDLLMNFGDIEYGVLYLIESVGTGLIASLVYGYSMGIVFNRYLEKEKFLEDPFSDLMG